MLNVITDMPLKRCKHCHAAQDTAELWRYKCPKADRHSFTEDYVSPFKEANNA